MFEESFFWSDDVMDNDSFIITVNMKKFSTLFIYGERNFDLLDCEINFGDGHIIRLNKIKQPIVRKYNKSGVYDISIKGKCFAPLSSFVSKNLIDIKQWGNVEGMTDWSWAFNSCENLIKISASDSPNIESCHSMFENCYKFNSDLSNWDVSNVIYMRRMFRNCHNFNSNLSNWNVSNVKDMHHIFYNCYKFNSDLSNWNIINVETMYNAFHNCKNKNENLIKIFNLKNL